MDTASPLSVAHSQECVPLQPQWHGSFSHTPTSPEVTGCPGTWATVAGVGRVCLEGSDGDQHCLTSAIARKTSVWVRGEALTRSPSAPVSELDSVCVWGGGWSHMPSFLPLDTFMWRPCVPGAGQFHTPGHEGSSWWEGHRFCFHSLHSAPSKSLGLGFLV
jgi:hypothetical protein